MVFNYLKERGKIMSIYDFKVRNNKGEMVSLSEYKGKVLLVVNTATKCGFTPQYKELQDIYEKYNDKGFEILDFPCNQFANQASGTDEEIAKFCTGLFGITFQQFAKIDVNGKNESELYSWLKSQKGGIFNTNIKWNFTKFLINKNGEVISRYSPNRNPADIENDIIKLLNE